MYQEKDAITIKKERREALINIHTLLKDIEHLTNNEPFYSAGDEVYLKANHALSMTYTFRLRLYVWNKVEYYKECADWH